MPTRRSQGMLGLIRAHKKLAAAVSRDVLQMELPLEAVARMRLRGTTAAVVQGFPMPALTVFPSTRAAQEGIILHLHGGAYVSGKMMQCRALISPICAWAGVPAFTFTYRLSPQHPYPAQLEDAMASWQYLLDQGYAPDKIILVGESAGGNLALALTMALKEQGKPLPGGLALLSPWVDLAQRGESYRTLAQVDATLNAEELMAAAVGFAGGRELTDPKISPVYGSFEGFPPVEIHCGTQEILLSDSENLEAALLRDGVEVHLMRWAGMCHVFQAFGFEESKESNRLIGAFVRRCIVKTQERPEK